MTESSKSTIFSKLEFEFSTFINYDIIIRLQIRMRLQKCLSRAQFDFFL